MDGSYRPEDGTYGLLLALTDESREYEKTLLRAQDVDGRLLLDAGEAGQIELLGATAGQTVVWVRALLSRTPSTEGPQWVLQPVTINRV
ncbi:hypothetical protein OAO01_07160, partial [Oligoflexia bacterium]|nr:hypothetical protein [Oligoflexia bacterium]